MKKSIRKLIKKRTVLLDGGMGTELMKYEFSQGMCPETWNEERPDVVKKIHESYFQAGADAILTNSFGGSALKLRSYGLEDKCYALNKMAAEIAAEVRPREKFVGGSVGPTGQFLEPQGRYKEEDLEKAYGEQVKGLVDGGVDFVLVETQYDLREARCACAAVKKHSSLPLFLTMTFNRTPRGFFTLMGNSLEDLCRAAEEWEADAVGANCTLDSRDMADLMREMRPLTSLPLIAQANAGQPVMDGDGRISYSQGLEDYVKYVPDIMKNGAGIIGGCCGTDPEYVKRMAAVLGLRDGV